MSRYRKYTDHYAAMVGAFKIPLDYENRPEAERKQRYIDDILADKSRATVVELRDGHSAAESENQIYSYEHYEKNPYYSQAVYDGRNLCLVFELNPTFLNKITGAFTQDGDQNYISKWGFPYIDQDGIDCALSVARFGHEPNAQYMITIMRHITDADNKRQVIVVCDENIATDDFFTHLQGEHQETALSANQVFPTVSDSIHSPQVNALFATIFDENGHIVEEKFEHFKTRLSHYNIDKRDILLPQFKRIIGCVRELDRKRAALIVKSYKNDPINFFEYDRYKRFLLVLLEKVQTSQTEKPERYTELQELYLEFIMIHFLYTKNNNGQEFITGLTPEVLADLERDYLALMPHTNDNIDLTHFKQNANKVYRRVYLNKILQESAQIIHVSEEPIRSFANTRLSWISQFDLTALSEPKQKTIFIFIKSLSTFTKNPCLATLNQLENMYRKVRLDPKELIPLKQCITLQLMNELKTKISKCKHAYIKEEAEKKWNYVNKLDFSDQSAERQVLLITLLETLNKLVNAAEANPNTLTELGNLYDQLGLIPIDKEKTDKLSVSPALSRVYHHIEHDQYTIDPQGRVLVIDFDSPHSTEPTIWNLAIDDIEIEHDIRTNFYQTLSRVLQKQTRAHAQIIVLYEKNKTAIYPLQQALQVYLSEIAQEWQAHLGTDVLNPHIIQTALLETAKRINATVIQYLAEGLLRASIQNGHVLSQLDMQTLNKTLIEKQESLYKLASRTLLDQIQRQNITPEGSMQRVTTEKPIRNAIRYWDRKQKLVTEITTIPGSLDYTCEQIQTLRLREDNKEPQSIQRKRIHTNALQIPEDVANAVYQEQVQTRIAQIATTCNFDPCKPLSCCMYAANSSEIQHTLQAIHRYNWHAISTQKHPLCWIQNYSTAESDQILGYPAFDWSGTISEQTLMCEINLCSQISVIDPGQHLDIQAYASFLDPDKSFFSRLTRTTVFAFSTEGKQIRSAIQVLKEKWRLAQNLDENLHNQQLTNKALQKLMAFDLHYDPEFAILVQTMALAISKQALLHDVSDGSVLANTLGQAQIFDLIPLPDTIIGSFMALIRSTDKQTATLAAAQLKNAMLTYCIKNQNATVSATLLPVMAQQTQKGRTDTTMRAKEQLTSQLLSSADSSPKIQRTTKHKSSAKDSSQTQRLKTSVAQQPDRLFARTAKQERTSTERQPRSLLSDAAKNKAHAYRNRGKS